MNYKSIDNLHADLIKNISSIPHDIDLVVGVPRSGLLVANMIALLLNKPLTDIEGFLADRIIHSGRTKDTGNHIKSVKECKRG